MFKKMKKEWIVRKCKKCGAIVRVIQDCECENGGMVCCDEPMEVLVPNSVDAAIEKHVPTYEKMDDGIFVTVNHVMEKAHFIEWLAVVSENKEYFVKLYPEQEAKVHMPYIPGSKLYAYCNQHGLWQTDVK